MAKEMKIKVNEIQCTREKRSEKKRGNIKQEDKEQMRKTIQREREERI